MSIQKINFLKDKTQTTIEFENMKKDKSWCFYLLTHLLLINNFVTKSLISYSRKN